MRAWKNTQDDETIKLAYMISGLVPSGRTLTLEQMEEGRRQLAMMRHTTEANRLATRLRRLACRETSAASNATT